MNLTADQCDALRDYVLAEEKALKNAMYDNTMSAAEIMSFLGRFIAATRDLGVTTSYEIGSINGYPGVSLTVTVNGQETKLDVYRTGMYWNVQYVGFTDEDDFRYVETEGGVMIVDYTGGDVTELTFPATLGGKPVVAIGGSYPDTLTSVVIPEGVKRIEEYALSYMGNLSSVSLPDSLEVIGKGAFECLPNLTEIHFGPNLRELGDAFERTGVTSVSLPASLETLGRTFDWIEVDPANPHFQSDQGALYNKDTHTLIYYPSNSSASYTLLPDTLHIMDGTFEGNTVIEAVELPEGLIDIGNYAFMGCSNLSYINLPDSVESIGHNAFEDVTMTQLHIPSRLFSGSRWDYLEEGQFNLRYNIESFQPDLNQIVSFTVGAGNRFFSSRYGVLFSADGKELIAYPAGRGGASYTVPDGTLSIASNAFQGSALTQIVLPESLTTLGYYCFSNVPLQSLTIPEGITHLGDLGYLKSLTELTLPASIASWDNYPWRLNVTPSQLTIKGYPNSLAVDIASYIGCAFEPIGESIGSITLDSQRLTVVLGETATVTAQTTGGPADVLNWHEQTQNTSGLLELSETRGAAVEFRAVRPGATTLVASAGYDGQTLASCTVEVVLPQNATEDVVFLPDDLSVIEPNAFAGAGLRRVIIPAGVTHIGSRAFYRCESLTVVQIPDSVTSIATNAFDGCDQLVIVCGANGYALQYAEAHDIPCCVMN